MRARPIPCEKHDPQGDVQEDLAGIVYGPPGNGISAPAAYRCLHEGPTVLARHAPGRSIAPARSAAAGYTHLKLDGTVFRTDRVAAAGPDSADLWWSGKHRRTRAASAMPPALAPAASSAP
jgi:hypothetical protein